MLRRLKSLLPRSVKPRTIPFGLASGCRAVVDFNCDAGFYFGRHERELFKHYRRLIYPGCRCFDIGGYRAWDAIIFAKLSDGAQVVTYEANPSGIAHIEATIEASGYDIAVVNAYVSDCDESHSVTIDHMADTHFVPDFIKMDIEGHEAVALAGASRVLDQRMPSLVVETHGIDVEKACIDLLTQKGYSPQLVVRKSYWAKETRGMKDNRWLVCSGRDVGTS